MRLGVAVRQTAGINGDAGLDEQDGRTHEVGVEAEEHSGGGTGAVAEAVRKQRHHAPVEDGGVADIPVDLAMGGVENQAGEPCLRYRLLSACGSGLGNGSGCHGVPSVLGPLR
ncbi:hypothetical protein AMK20_13555 [Streptomyces sp. TSRI0261]|nr:hypothetical protein AMK20_13555 [Streptomyces sp. TSRI0261]